MIILRLGWLTSRSGLSEEQDLHQYVVYDTPTRKGPKRINLNDPSPNRAMDGYTPPSSLSVHLSKIPMPELQPKASATATPEKSILDKKAQKQAQKEAKDREKAAKKGKGKETAQMDAPGSHRLFAGLPYADLYFLQSRRSHPPTTRRSSRKPLPRCLRVVPG